MTTTYYFYKITNTINDKIYIGSTINPKERWWRHRSDSRNKKIGKICVINILMKELGMDNFNFKVFEMGEYDTRQKACEREDELIKEYKGINKMCASTKQRIKNGKEYKKKYDQRDYVIEKHRKHKEKIKTTLEYKESNKKYNALETTKQRKREWAKTKGKENRLKDPEKYLNVSRRYHKANKEVLARKRKEKYWWTKSCDKLNCIDLSIFE